MIDAIVGVISPCSNTIRGHMPILVDDVALLRRRCVDEDVDEDHIDIDLGDIVSVGIK
jgi:hypothetical protein